MSDHPPPSDSDPSDVPPEIVAQLVRALDRSPSTFTVLIGRDLKTRWLSRSATWVTGTDPNSRRGKESLERVHPDDVPRLLEAFQQLEEASETSPAPGIPVVEPLRYRLGNDEDGWITREALVNNLLHDPEVDGLLLIVRPVPGALDGVGHVIDLLVADASMPEVLAGCAALVPAYIGDAAVIGLVDGEEVVGIPDGSPARSLCDDPRWWADSLADGKVRAQCDFADFADDLAEPARALGYFSAWVLPVLEPSSGEVIGCVAVWVRINWELSIGTDHGLRQAQRLASLVIGEQRQELVLRREAVTDPLTGVGNRSALRRRLDAATEVVSLAFVDLDDFKAVNDTYGHDAGDTVLREVARRLGLSVREDDLVVRLGGDEFGIVFADATPPEAIDSLIERVREAIEAPVVLGEDDAEDAGVTVQVRASVGVATGPPGEVVHRADDALYATKRRKQ